MATPPTTPILMPQVGENLAAGTVLEWHVQVGDPVTRGQVVLSVESEKAVFEVQAEADGVLTEILVPAGEEGAVLEPVAYLRGQVDTVPTPAPAARTAAPRPPVTQAPVAQAPVTQAPSAPAQAAATGRPLASPAARRRARELGLDLSRVAGSGAGGRIVVRDIAAAASPGTAPADRVVPFSRLRRHIAARTSLSSHTIPHLYLFADVDMTAALALAEGAGPDVGVTDLLIASLARALRQFPRLNGHVEDDRLTIKGAVNVGVTACAPDGVLLPVVADAGGKTLAQIAAARRQNAAAARRGAISLRARGTITLADLSDCDVYRVLPLINPPECAVLGAGAIQERVVSRQREPAIRDIMSLGLGCDHRAVDAEYGARFLDCLKTLLEQPPAAGAGGASHA